MRAFKITLYTIISLIVLLIIAAVVVANVVNPNDYKPKITQLVSEKTGMQLQLNGNLEWSFFPWIGVRINDIALQNPDGFLVKSLASIQEADIKVRLLPLLSEKVEVSHVTLKGLVVNLQRQPNGFTNIDGLMKQYHVKYSAAAAAEYAKATGDQNNPAKAMVASVNTAVNSEIAQVPTALAGLAVGEFNIENATVNWVDQQSNQTVALKNLNFSTKNVALNQSFPIELSFTVDQTTPTVRSVSVDLSADALANLAGKDYQLNQLQVSGHYIQGSNNLPFSLKTNLDLNLSNESAALSALQASLSDLDMNGDFTLSTLTTTPTVKGTLHIPQFSTDFLKAFVPPAAALPKQASADLTFQAAPKYVKISDLKLGLDNSHLTGMLNFANFTGPNVVFDLKADQINLDQYLPAQAAAAASGQTSSAVSTSSGYSRAPILPVGFLKTLQVNGSLSVGQLTQKQLSLSAVQFNVSTQNQTFTSTLKANFAKGSVTVNNTLNVAGTAPMMNTTVAANGVDIQMLMAATTRHAFLSGFGQFNGNFKMVGNSIYDWVNQLSGQGRFALNQGAINGVDVNYYSDLAKALMNKQLSTPTPNTNKTPFDQFSASFTIQSGIFTNNDLRVSSGKFLATGNGQVNLPAQTINYKVLVNAGSNVQIPLKITGPLSNPNESLDMDAILKTQVAQVVDRTKKQVTQQVTQSVNNFLKKQKINLFG